MGLTGIAPVIGALSMWNVEETPLFRLFILFFIGCLSHVYGFVLNDVIDIKIDKLSIELSSRPLVRGAITLKKATFFAFVCMIISFILTILFFNNLNGFSYIISILIIAYIFATIYNFISKKYLGMDIFVTGAIFLLIIFGASAASFEGLLTTPILWIVAIIGSIQVLFMNMINGAIKDIDHDEKGMAKTLPIWLGVKVKANEIYLPFSFKTIGYILETSRVSLIFLPFILLPDIFKPEIFQISLLVIFVIITYYSIYKLFSIRKFYRYKVRKNIGIIVIFMYATTPILLYSLNPYILIIALIPPIWFIFSNLLLHKTILEAKTM
jgi:4-hydroxybenzoate polyprenyltransferase